MLRLGNKFRARVELRKQVGLASRATGVHQRLPGCSACSPPSGNAQSGRSHEKDADKSSLDSLLSEQSVESRGRQQTYKQRREKTKLRNTPETIEAWDPVIQKTKQWGVPAKRQEKTNENDNERTPFGCTLAPKGCVDGKRQAGHAHEKRRFP